MKLDRQRFLDDLRYLATQDVKWLHQGRSIETGMDCIGAPRYAVEMQGLHLPLELQQEFDTYHRPPDGQRMLAVMRKWLIEITREELQPSDLIVIFHRRNPCHLVVQMENDEVAEAYQGVAVSKFVIRPIDPRHRIAACFRIPDELE